MKKKSFIVFTLIGLLLLSGCSKDSSKTGSKSLEGVKYFIEDANYDNSYLVRVFEEKDEKEDLENYRKGRFYRIDPKGNVLSEYPEDIKITSPFYEDEIIAGKYRNDINKFRDEENLYLGVLSIEGEWVIEPKYLMIDKFNDNYYHIVWVEFDENGPTDIYSGFMDRDENILHKEVIEENDLARINDFLPVRTKSKLTERETDLLLTQGGMELDPKNKKVEDFCKKFEDKFKTELKNPTPVGDDIVFKTDIGHHLIVNPKSMEKVGMLDKSFVKFLDYQSYNDNTYWSIKTDGDTKSYELIVKSKPSNIISYNSAPDIYNERIIITNKDGSKSVVDRHGKIISKDKYMDITNFNQDGFAFAQTFDKDKAGKWIIIDKDGNTHLDESKNIEYVLKNNNISKSLLLLEKKKDDEFNKLVKEDHWSNVTESQFIGIKKGSSHEFGFINLKTKEFTPLKDFEKNILK